MDVRKPSGVVQRSHSDRHRLHGGGVSSNQVEIDIGQQDRAATAWTLNKARRRQPLQGDS